MKKLKAKQEVYYASRTRHPGEEFEADDSHANLLVGLGKAEEVRSQPAPRATPAQEPTPSPAPSLETRSMSAEEPKSEEQPAEQAEGAPRRRRREYMRRDMKATDE